MSRQLNSQHWQMRKIVAPAALIVLFASTVTPRSATAEDLACWNFEVFVGGYDAKGAQALRILSEDPNGNINGTFWGDPIQGVYNKNSNELMFVRQISGSTDPSYTQVWTGYYWPESQYSTTYLIAGYLEEFLGNSDLANHHRDGW